MAKKTSNIEAAGVVAQGKALPKGVSADGRTVLTIRTPLTQDPHAIRDTREKVLEVAIGHEVRAGHQYNLLGHIGANTSGVVVEPYLITLTEDSDVFPTFQHAVMEFLYMLEGEVVYRHGSHLYPMKPGDSLFFDADAPHGPEEL